MKLAVIGGGVAGMSAALYALRAGVEVDVFEQLGLMGGVVATLNEIENYPGTGKISGFELTEKMNAQIKSLGAVQKREKVLSVEQVNDGFLILTNKGESYYKAVVLATGTVRKSLGIEKSFVGKGVSYCATCDGNFYRNKPVAVVGYGREAVDEAIYLANLCSKVVLLCPEQMLVAEQIQKTRLENEPKIQVIHNANVVEILSTNDVVSGAKVEIEGENQVFDFDAIFFALGQNPKVSYLNVPVEFNNDYVVTSDKMETSVKGLFACGDVIHSNLKQIVTACSTGAVAGHYSAIYLKKQN